MTSGRELSAPDYDIVVIGGGLAGLTAAAIAAKEGRSVLVVEQQPHLGGYARGFSRGAYRFDAGIHGTSFGTIEPTLMTLLDGLGVGDRVEFIRCEPPLYSVFLPGLRFDAPEGDDEFVAAHAAFAPDDGDALRRLYGDMQIVTEQLTRPRPTGTLQSMTDAQDGLNVLLRYRTATLAEVFAEHSLSPRLCTVLAAPWINLGLPPSRMSFVSWAAMTVVRTQTGEQYCRGSFQQLVDALAHAIESSGGEIRVGTAARRIGVEDGRATSVELDGGARVGARAVISGADARQTFERLVGLEQLPEKFARRLSRMRESLSAVVVYAATALSREAVDLPHVSYLHDTWDGDEAYTRMARGEPSAIMVTVPTLTDPSVAPPGEQLVNCVALVDRRDDGFWEREKAGITEHLLERIDRVMPGFLANLTVAEAASPVSLERHAWNHRGAAYGWDNAPDQIGSRRLGSVTPVEKLFLAGHWAQPGTGGLAAVYSGVRAANSALGRPAEHLGAAT